MKNRVCNKNYRWNIIFIESFPSSNCINIYSSYTDPLQSGSVGGPAPVDGAPLDGSGHVNVRRSACGVFRCPNDNDSDGGNQFSSDQLYLLEHGCTRHGPMSDYTMEDMYQSPKDPFDG